MSIERSDDESTRASERVRQNISNCLKCYCAQLSCRLSRGRGAIECLWVRLGGRAPLPAFPDDEFESRYIAQQQSAAATAYSVLNQYAQEGEDQDLQDFCRKMLERVAFHGKRSQG